MLQIIGSALRIDLSTYGSIDPSPLILLAWYQKYMQRGLQGRALTLKSHWTSNTLGLLHRYCDRLWN